MFTVKTFKPLPKQLKQDICRTFALPFLETSEIEYIPADLGPPFAIRRIKGDGNCLFRALAFMICGDEDQHFKVRTIIVDYIETSQAVEQSGVLGSDPLTYLRMTKMSEDRTWGTDVELMVASAAFQIPIYTYTQYGGQYKWLEFLPREITRDCSRTFTCALYIQHTSLCHYDVVTSVKCNHDVENYGQATQLDNCKVLTLSDTDQDVSEEEDVLGMSVDMIHETNILTTSKQFIEYIAASSDELVVSLEESVDELGVSLANLDISEMREEMNDSKQNSSGDFNMSTQIKEDSFNDSAESFSLLVENDDILMMGNRQTVDPYDFVSEIEDTLFTPSAMQLTSTPRKMKKSTQEAKDKIITDDEETEDNLSINDISFQESATAFKQNFTPRVKTSKLLQKALDNSRLSIKKLKCCNCLPTITEDSIKNCRYRFWSKSIEQRVEWFLDKASEVKIKQGRTFFNIHGGKRVCSFCFRNLYKISKNFFYKYLKKGRKGDFAAGVLRRRGMGKTTNQAISWIEDYSSNRADQMPNNSDLMLPCGTRKISIYEQYVAEKTENLNYSVSRSAFYKLWVDRFSHLKIKQVNSFSKCTVCVYIERDLQKTRDPVQRAYLKKLMTVHNDRQMTERRYYYEKREQAKLNPSKYMSIIVDGMDQAYIVAMQLTSTPRKMKKSTQEAKDQIITDDEETEDNLSINDISFQESATAFKQNFTPRVKTSKLLQKALDNSRLSIKKLKCCNCLPTITEDSIKNCRYRFWSKSIEQRVEWFLDKASEVKIKQGRTFFNIHGGKRVCSFCFRDLYKISKNFFYKYLKKGRKGDFAAGVLRRRGMGKTTNQAISWIEDYSSNRADQMPNNSDLMLPCGTRKISIYEQYVAEKTENLNYSVSRSAFYKLWVDRFSHLKIKQVNSFSKCTVCVYIERDLQKTRDPVQRAYLKKLMTVHNDRQMTERRYYYEKREQAKLNPSKYMSIIVDGMDQAKTNLPHFTGRLHKGIDPSSLLKTHIQGVINHGMHTFDTYVDICEYSHDANLVMNIILRSINAAIAKDGKLPEVLFIQADNCARENKNKYILGFCEVLIMLSVFKEVHLSFLYVGHTHEDIDAAFSKIAETLRSKDVETIPKLLMTVGAVQLQGLFDIKSWLMGYLKDVKHHSKPLHFKFTRNSTNTTCSWYRANNTKPWVRLEETILHGVPAGKPLILVPPNFGKIMVEGIKSNIEKSRYIMSGETQYRWWCGFIAELKELQQSEKKVKQYARKGALWLLPQLQNKAFLHQHKVKEISIASHIETLMDKDLDEKVVTVHCKKSRKKTTATRKPVAKQ